MINQGVKIGRGVVDKYRPYKGYKLVYGSKTLADVKAIGGIPLTVYFGNFGGGRIGKGWSYHKLTINGKTINIENRVYSGGDGVWAEGYASVYLDLDSYYEGDLATLSSISSIGVTGVDGTAYHTENKIIKWLEPISSGGGVAYKLLSLIHHIIQKDGGER